MLGTLLQMVSSPRIYQPTKNIYLYLYRVSSQDELITTFSWKDILCRLYISGEFVPSKARILLSSSSKMGGSSMGKF